MWDGRQAREIRCWSAPEDIKIGDKFRDTIHNSIVVFDNLIFILSENSVKSDWVEKEVTAAISKKRKEKSPMLFPIRIDNSNIKEDKTWNDIIKNESQIYDFTNWKNHKDYKKSIDRLLIDLQLTDE